MPLPHDPPSGLACFLPAHPGTARLLPDWCPAVFLHPARCHGRLPACSGLTVVWTPRCISHGVPRLPWRPQPPRSFTGWQMLHSSVEHLSECRISHCDCDPLLCWEDFATAASQAYCHIQKEKHRWPPCLAFSVALHRLSCQQGPLCP